MQVPQLLQDAASRRSLLQPTNDLVGGLRPIRFARAGFEFQGFDSIIIGFGPLPSAAQISAAFRLSPI